MFKIREKEIPTAIGIYYITVICHLIVLAVIKLTGWNTFTNLLFFGVSFIALGLAAYLLHIYFKEDTEEMSEEEELMKSDFGQIWVILADIIILFLFLFTW